MNALNPFEIEQAVKEHGGLAMIAILTTQTCGEACWHAKEDVCRCSCGGRNHGCLNHSTATPERTAKIDGHAYKLLAIGKYDDVCSQACEINRLAGYSSVERPTLVKDDKGDWWSQYKYTWSTSQRGAPARLKTVSPHQRKWAELSGWKDEPTVYLLWQRLVMPPKPANLVIDKTTGLPWQIKPQTIAMYKLSRNGPSHVPRDYYPVRSGDVQIDDLLWTPESSQWEIVTSTDAELGRPVQAFKAVCRSHKP